MYKLQTTTLKKTELLPCCVKYQIYDMYQVHDTKCTFSVFYNTCCSMSPRDAGILNIDSAIDELQEQKAPKR